ncbi:Alternative dihydrofolate reductase 3 [Georgfuchsia toluolica]|uniref:Alternative dihydrofolate reductase 3 n=1 Tax=Georgfuchsia toluolica TaxID=424218 RepID=A0A916J6X5_9PROT|nr:nuclear transport factor 2 family protein [Georgfuchsia toluolica]CAG4885052.1 Alternative dihydrofolate reductase 3 [Georgfuchsia toluolica]
MSKAFFATPQDVEAAFYEAIERADLDALMQVWSEDEEIVCILPGGPRLAGYAMVREAWRRVFGGGTRLRVQVTPLSFVVSPFTAIHSLVQYVNVNDDPAQQTPVVATNVYARGPTGWRLVVHHASPAPPDSFSEAPKTLH